MVFLTLELTEIVLFAGGFAGNTSIIKVGGYLGIITALVAWYTSAAGVISDMAPPGPRDQSCLGSVCPCIRS